MTSIPAKTVFQPGRYAAIDIGTVTCRMLIADVDEQGIVTPVSLDGEVCNLGAGVDKTGYLAPESIDRTVATIERFAATLLSMSEGQEIPVRACATSASRDAKNAAEFRERVIALGIVPEVIPGAEEAALSFKGATSAFPHEKVVVSDVGGGSTEVIAGHAGASPAYAHSFNVGCRRVTERFFTQDPPTPEQIEQATQWIASEFTPYMETLREKGYFEGRFVSVAGTATSIVAILKNMATYDSDRVQGAQLTREALDELIARVAPMTLEQRQQIVGLDPARAPVILAGLLIQQQLMEVAGLDCVTVSDRGIRHGMILDMAQRVVPASS